MANCYVIGGFAESQLSTDTVGLFPVWVDLPTLILGGFGKLRLAPDGESPGPPDGIQLYASKALAPYVEFPSVQLGLQMLPHGVIVRIAWYDWRKTHYQAGVILANRIRQQNTAADPCTIIGHSAGGLVARAIWTELGTTGDQDLVRRIITLGTPHQGSYEPVVTWAGESQLLQQIYQLNQGVGSLAWGAAHLVGYRAWTIGQLRQLCLTWPALYELLPLLDVPSAVSDPNRPGLYDAANWPSDVRPSQSWLNWSKNNFGPWLRSAASKPPSHILTCVSAYFQPTYSRLDDPDSLGQVTGLQAAEPGDGVVTRSSAELETGFVIRVTCDHASLLPDLVNSGELREWILAERSPTPIPPPPEVIPTIMPSVLAGPPLTQRIVPYAGGVGCGSIKCSC